MDTTNKVSDTANYFITGASGNIGKALYFRLSPYGKVTGTGRNEPSWWHPKDRS